MRRFERALTREMAVGAALGFAALVAIFSVVILVRTLSKAVAGDIDSTAILPMMGFGVLRTLPVLLSLGLFMGVFMSLSRLWRDSEAVIWMNAGVGPWGWIRPVVILILPVVAIIAFVSFEGLAWGARKQAEFERVLAAKNQVSALVPGVFSEDQQGKRVVFVERVSQDGSRVENVFVQSFERGRMGVTVASHGVIKKMPNDDVFLVLEDGKRYEGIPGDADYQLAHFNRYSVRIPAPVLIEREMTARSMQAVDLLHNPNPSNMGEWVWRLGYPISAFLLCLLAVPLSYTNPRAGRSLNVVFAVLIYLAYNNFVGLSKGWVERALLGPVQGMVLVHGVMLIVLIFMFWRRFRGPWSS